MIMQGNADSVFKIFNLVAGDTQADPTGFVGDIDYKKDLICRLHRKETWNKGFLEKVEYYKDYDLANDIYSNIILEVEQIYTYENAMIFHRQKNWYYYTEDEQRILMKGGDIKYYNSNIEKRSEGRRRRQNVVDNMDIAVVGLLMMTGLYSMEYVMSECKQFALDTLSEREDYIYNDNYTVYQDRINNDTTYAWLDTIVATDTTMRQWAINELTF